MKLNYYADTYSLYIDLSERVSVESREISEGVVLDYDAAPEYASSAYSLLLLYFAHRFATLNVVESVTGVRP